MRVTADRRRERPVRAKADVTPEPLDEIIATISKLETEREAIYVDEKVDEKERPRLRQIEAECDRLWDLRRRLEAAKNAGLDHVPVSPPPDPSKLTG